MRYEILFTKGFEKEDVVYTVYSNKESDAIALAKILSTPCYVWVCDNEIKDDAPIIFCNH